MIKYNCKYSVSDVASILKVEKQLVKDWAYHFSEYLNPKANPEKGVAREFTRDDLSTLGYVMMYWEDEPDFENIKYGLNTGGQYESPYLEIADEVTPIFQEFSDEDLGRSEWIIGGMVGNIDLKELGDYYRQAGDRLIDQVLKLEDFGFIYPIAYSYRHATELYLKSVIWKAHARVPLEKRNHKLASLYGEFCQLLCERFEVSPPDWFSNIVSVFDDFDPNSTAFRYGEQISHDEMVVDLHHIRKMMSRFAESIQRIHKAFSGET